MTDGSSFINKSSGLDISPIPCKSYSDMEEHSAYFESKLRAILDSHKRHEDAINTESSVNTLNEKLAEFGSGLFMNDNSAVLDEVQFIPS